MKTGLIYKIENKLNGKVYIGLTTRNFEERMKEYKYHYENPKYLKHSAIMKAIRKYGLDNFSFSVIEEDIPNNILDEKEMFYIDKFDCQVPKGYNILEGGRIEAVRKMGKSNAKPVYRIDEKTLEIIDYASSMSKMSRKSGVSVSRISAICYKADSKGKPAYSSKGYIFRFIDDYDKEDIIEMLSAKNSIAAKRIIAFYLDKPEPIADDGGIEPHKNSEIIGEFKSYYEAAKKLGLSSGAISEYCKGKRVSAGLLYDEDEDGRRVGFAFIDDKVGNLDARIIRSRPINSQYNKEKYNQPIEMFYIDTGEVIQTYKNYDDMKSQMPINKTKFTNSVAKGYPFVAKGGKKVGLRLIT